MKKKRKLKKKVIVFIIIFILIILSLVSVFVYKSMTPKNSSTVKVVEKIEDYGYYLEDDQPKIYKELFKELVTVLKNEKVDYDKYASLISRMAVIDFYNLDNKVSKNDVGATQFIREKNKANFVLQASETVYKYIEQNIYGDREQELPVVKTVNVINQKTEAYKYKKISDDKAYTVTVGVEYEKDLGYPKEVTVKLLHDGKKLVIYEMNSN